MSNWKRCLPKNPKYEGANNQFCIMEIMVSPHQSVTVKCQVLYQNSVLANECITISGDEYNEWGTDDNWIYQKVTVKLGLGTLEE